MSHVALAMCSNLTIAGIEASRCKITQTLTILLKAALLTACCVLSPTFAQTPGGKHVVVGRIGVDTVYEDDLPPIVQAQLHQLRDQEYQLESDAIGKVSIQRVIEHEARRQGLSAESLLNKIDLTVPEPKPEAVWAFYLARKEEVGKPFEDVESEIRTELKRAETDEARSNYVNALPEASEMVVLLPRPRVRVDADPARTMGSLNFPVTIVEFADFQCPFCRKAEATIKDVLAKYKGRVALSFRDFPLSRIHPEARMAAEAARCAGDEGKFWEYHDLLFRLSANLSKERLVQAAESLHLEEGMFRACLDSGRSKGAVEEDLRAGVRAGVTSTPTFFINGVRIKGAQSTVAFETVINGELSIK